MIKRKPNWNIILSEYLSKVKDKRFKWGTHDCVMHSVNAVRKMTGFDMAKGRRQTYKSKKKAYEIVDRDFKGDTDNMFIEHLGEPLTNYKKAMRGDLVRITLEDIKAYGVVDDTGRRIAMVGGSGLFNLPINLTEIYWRVG